MMRKLIIAAALVMISACNIPDESGELVPPKRRIEQVRVRPLEEKRIAARERLMAIREASSASRALELRSIAPRETTAGVRVNVHGGESVIGIVSRNATPSTRLLFDGEPLRTTYGTPIFLSARIPDQLIAKPGVHEVMLRNERGDSNRLTFTVK
jgi:hypothetical protein